jgi:hypothetical protein
MLKTNKDVSYIRKYNKNGNNFYSRNFNCVLCENNVLSLILLFPLYYPQNGLQNDSVTDWLADLLSEWLNEWFKCCPQIFILFSSLMVLKRNMARGENEKNESARKENKIEHLKRKIKEQQRKSPAVKNVMEKEQEEKGKKS